jgi:hypothetical protein
VISRRQRERKRGHAEIAESKERKQQEKKRKRHEPVQKEFQVEAKKEIKARK